jgi:hypothetical protein
LDRQQRLLIDKANAVKQYFDYLANKSDANQQQAALAVLASLGYTDLVIKVVASDPSSSNVRALAAIATTGDSETANLAVGALESIRSAAVNVEGTQAAEQALTSAQASQQHFAGGGAIVAGADRALSGAQAEANRLKAAGFDDVRVVKRGDWYRTIVPVKGEANSAATLEKIKSQVRPSAYAVDLAKWCQESLQAGNCVKAQ